MVGARDRDTGRNGEKTDICSTRAARLKELSSPAHHRKVFKCRHSVLLSNYWEKSEQQKQREERFGWWVGFKCEKRHRGWGKQRILFWYSERKDVLELVVRLLDMFWHFWKKTAQCSELYTEFLPCFDFNGGTRPTWYHFKNSLMKCHNINSRPRSGIDDDVRPLKSPCFVLFFDVWASIKKF